MANALIIHSPNHVSLEELKLSRLEANEVLIKVMACGICGTDIHIFRGEYMGDYPIIPGHEFSGIVEQVGESVTRFQVGNHVAIEPNISCDNCYNCLNNRQNFCLNWQAIGVTKPGGMAQYVIVSEKAVFSINKLPFEHGAFMEPLSCVLHGAERLNARIADRVAILGAGPIGILFLQLMKLQGSVHISVIEKQTSRLELAEKFGVSDLYNDINEMRNNDFDIVIDATGIIPLMEKTIDLAKPGGKILLFGVPAAGKNIQVEAFKIFKKGLTILSSFTSVRNSFQAIELLESKQIDVSNLISHVFPLSEFGKGVEIIENGLENVKKVLIQPQQ